MGVGGISPQLGELSGAGVGSAFKMTGKGGRDRLAFVRSKNFLLGDRGQTRQKRYRIRILDLRIAGGETWYSKGRSKRFNPAQKRLFIYLAI